MIRDHDLIEELMAVNALAGLDGGDTELLESLRAEHGLDCAECDRIDAEFAEIAGRIGFSLDPVAVRDEMADEILARARGPQAVQPAAEAQAPRPARRWRAIVAVAASLILVVGGIGVWNTTRPHAQTVVLAGAGPQRLSVTVTPGKAGVHATGTGFQNLPTAQVYELWTIRGTTPIKVACFTPSSGSVTIDGQTVVQTSDLMAVTVETGCPSAPTSTPIISAKVS